MCHSAPNAIDIWPETIAVIFSAGWPSAADGARPRAVHDPSAGSPAALSTVYVHSSTNREIPLSAIARFEPSDAPLSTPDDVDDAVASARAVATRWRLVDSGVVVGVGVDDVVAGTARLDPGHHHSDPRAGEPSV